MTQQKTTQGNLALVRTVMHEMRSPLTVIRAYSSAVQGRRVTLSLNETKDVMRRIENCARLLEVIVGDLETLTELGTVRFKPAVVEMRSYLEEMAIDLQALIPGRALGLLVEEASAYIDADRLRQVITNLVENAHKYSTPGGAIGIHVERRPKVVRIAVQDEGPGVEPADMEQIFRPFFRATPGDGRDGRGLGLAICKGLIEAQGGTLKAARIPGGRFELAITLPLVA